MVKVFVSHSHADKSIARRVVWRLDAYGISAWMDERGLRKGEALEDGVRKAIDSTDAMVVIATRAAARSKWVRLEIAHAKARGKNRAIYPFFIDDVRKHKLFNTHLGILAMDSHLIEQRVFELAKALGASCSPSSAPNLERLREAIDALKMEGSAVGLLIDGILHGLHGPGLPVQQEQTLGEVPFHILDFTLNALYDIVEGSAKDAVANLAACYFRQTGAGGYVLERYLDSSRCSAEATAMLADAVGGPLASNHLDEALRLLLISGPPNDRALFRFVEANNAALSNEQWAIVIRLVTSWVRRPGTFAQQAAFEVLTHKPDNESVRLLLSRWIIEGQFDQPPLYEFRLFAHLMKKAHRRRLCWYKQIAEDLIQHIRTLIRSKDRAKVEIAIEHLKVAADKQCSFFVRIAEECERLEVPVASEMDLYVAAHVKAALRDRNWHEAKKEYEQQWETVQLTRTNEEAGPK